MRSNRIAAATALVALSLGSGACASKDATGPSIGLSQEEVFNLAGELGNVMTSANLVSLQPGPIHMTVGCVNGGTAAANGSYAGTTTVTADVTLGYDGCRTAHYATSGSVRVTGGGVSTDSSLAANATFAGTLSVVTSDGRSGSCEIELTVTAGVSQTEQLAYTVTGAACGVNVSGVY